MISNNSQQTTSKYDNRVSDTEATSASQARQMPAPSDIEPTSGNENPEETKPTLTREHSEDSDREDLSDETKKSLIRSKSLILGALVVVPALFGMYILAKSGCGSLSFKLVPPELQLNTGSCAQVEQTPGQSLTKN
jgi:hypothetical protein